MSFPNAPRANITEGQSLLGGFKLASPWKQWFNKLQAIIQSLLASGPPTGRPTINLWDGQRFYNTFSQRLETWNGAAWVAAVPSRGGVFHDSTDQTAAVINTPYVIAIGATDLSAGISVVGGNKLTFAVPGSYKISYHIRLSNSDAVTSNPQQTNIWLRYNGTDMANTRINCSALPNLDTTSGHTIVSGFSYVGIAAGNDYVQLVWYTANTNIAIRSLAAGTTPDRPAAPGVYILVEAV